MIEVPAFDYESKRWGASPIRPLPWYVQGLKLRRALDALDGISGDVVDIGCGAGNVARAMAEARPDLRVHGVDISEGALEVARRSAPKVDFHLAPAGVLPFADGSMSAAFMFDVLEHLEDPAATLREIRRVLRPGGMFHIVLPVEVQPWTFYRFVSRLGWKAKLHHCGHIQLFDAARFEAMAAAEGLPVREVRWSFHWLYSLVDIGYFSFLEVRGPVGTSVEDYAAHGRGVAGLALRWIKDALSTFGWYESRLLERVPAGTGHFTCIRT
ncbi:MAG TPA: class I SAM-dependent methyltransferase [Candidatus Dormibacteraeota bacterium]|jgi:SAM-dependent methyltransferase